MFGAKKKPRCVVITHATGDRAAALDLARALENEGIAIWMAPRDVDPARTSAVQVQETIQASFGVLMLISRAANDSKLLKTEAEIAIDTAPLIPVRIEDETPAAALRALVPGQPVYDVFGEAGAEGLARLVDMLTGLQGGKRRPKAPPPPPITPPPSESIPAPSDVDAGEEFLPTGDAPAYDGLRPLGDNGALRTFIGPRADVLIERWRGMDQRGTELSPFLAGLLFGRYWLAYRKLTLSALGSSLVALALVAFAFRADDRDLAGGPPIAIAGIVALSIAVWLWGITLYRNHAERRAQRINAPDLDPDEVDERLARRGGVSWSRVVLLAIFEFVATVAIARAVDPGFLVWLLTPYTPPALEKTDLVEMTPPPEDKARYNFCITNPTGVQIRFLLHYGTAAPQSHDIEPHSKIYTFWSRQALSPVLFFDHVIGDGDAYSERRYGLTTGRTDDQKSCGGIVYYFTLNGRDLDLQHRPEDAAKPVATPVANSAKP